MKKIINLSLCLLASSLLLLGCQKGGDNKQSSLPDSSEEETSSEEHKHRFSSDWSYDSEYHWHAAICGHNVVKDKGEHDFIEEEITDAQGTYMKYTCNICGYVYDTCNTKEITWVNWDDEKIYSEYIEVGEMPEYDEVTYGIPRKLSNDPMVGYEFVGWEPEVVRVTEAATYKAKFDECTPFYVVRWLNWDGSVLETDPKVLAGETPSYDGATPTRPATAEQNYTFTGWNPDPTQPVDHDTDFVAQFNGATNTYPVRWENYDGSLLDAEVYEYGETPSYKGTTPIRTSTDPYYAYTFKGWTPEFSIVTSAQTYTATYNQIETSTCFTYASNGDDTYSITGLNAAVTDLYIPAKHDGKYVTAIAEDAFNSYLTVIKSIQFQTGSHFTTLARYLFENANQLVTVDMSNTLIASIPYSCFNTCTRLTTVTFSSSTTELGDSTFYACSALKNSNGSSGLDLANITTVGNHAFYECYSFSSVTGSKIENIGNYAFATNSVRSSDALTSVSFNNSSSKVSIGGRAFSNRSKITTFTLNTTKGFGSIGSYAFSNCSSLIRSGNSCLGVIAGTATSIGSSAFYNTEINSFVINAGSNIHLFRGCLVHVKSNTSEPITLVKYSGEGRLGELFVGTYSSADYYVAPITTVICTTDASTIIPPSLLACYTNGSSTQEVPYVDNLTINPGITYINSYILKYNTRITQIRFTGTKAQWNNIEKHDYWARFSSLTKVVCNNGEIALSV